MTIETNVAHAINIIVNKLLFFIFINVQTDKKCPTTFLLWGLRCPGQASGYYKIYTENRLNRQELEDLTSGYKHNGFYGNHSFSIDHKNEGILAFEGFGLSYGGTWWIKDDLLCYRFERPDLIDFDDCRIKDYGKKC